MEDHIVLRLDAPLMSFGGPVVDQRGGTRESPGRSMLVGLIANALGWEHGDFDKLQGLQSALVYAARCDRPGSLLGDFQTVDLGQPHLRLGWTTWGKTEARGGGSSSGTHIRYRDFLAGGVYTVALTLTAPSPSLDDVERALREPARPLFLGRKPCIPSAPLFLDRRKGLSALDVLRGVPPVNGTEEESFLAWWPDGMEDEGVVQSRVLSVSDDRDWSNRIHSGRRYVREGRVRYRKGDAA